ncbi:hypothetical protein [Microbacterium sulfonylureivorans]|uniref:hypothetical protein n=1 Tax=Microbacterium sulfonylureivorans TaxID=2486854 RepID=UPI000FDC5973|nr:hypothetical protein [Microbacterium sulfonylureivorans]
MMGSQIVRIVVRGKLGPDLVAALDGFEVEPAPDRCTSIRGPVPDQARLIGLLEMFDELHIEVVSVNPVVGPIA